MDSIEFCAGAGGQALGLEQAGFCHQALVEIEPEFAATLSLNRPQWNVFAQDMGTFDGSPYKGVELFAAGLPCPPFSVAGKQLGPRDERNLFPAALQLIDQIRPKAIMIENVKGFLSPIFQEYREALDKDLKKLGYIMRVKLLNASSFGLAQLRPRVVIVALPASVASEFVWPQPEAVVDRAVGDELFDLMAANGWKKAGDWRDLARSIGPTIVGGSKKHGGPDLGPTRARQAWALLGVEGRSLAAEAPPPDFDGKPRLTIRMVARLQGFPDDWQFFGKKTTAYRQVGNAFPPPVAAAVAAEIKKVIGTRRYLAAA